MKLIDAFISKNAAKILWLAAGILITFIFMQQCKGRKQSEAFKVLEAKAKTLEQKVAASEAQRLEGRKQFEDYKKDAEGRHQLVAIEKQEADKKVQAQQRTIDRLVGIVRAEKPANPVGVKSVYVSAAYKDACDSLPAEIDKLNLALADKDSSINGILDLYSYEIQIRDEELFKEMNYSDSLKVDFVRQTKLLRSALQQGKPRGRLLGGISVLGNQTNFLSGVGVVLAYQTKGGKQYQVSPKFIKVPGQSSAEVYYEGTVLFTIFR